MSRILIYLRIAHKHSLLEATMAHLSQSEQDRARWLRNILVNTQSNSGLRTLYDKIQDLIDPLVQRLDTEVDDSADPSRTANPTSENGKSLLVEELKNCDRSALARKLVEEQSAFAETEQRRKEGRGLSKETLDLSFEI